MTLFISIVLLCLVWTDVRDYLYGEHGYSFEVDQKVGTEMQVNLDMTVAMKCHCEWIERHKVEKKVARQGGGMSASAYIDDTFLRQKRDWEIERIGMTIAARWRGRKGPR